MTDLDVFARTAIFASIPAESFGSLEPSLKRRRLPRGAYVWLTGDPSTAVYVLVEGKMKVSIVSPRGDEIVVDLVLPGELFGDVAVFIDNAPRMTECVAVEDSVCVSLDRQTLLTFLAAEPLAMRRMLARLATLVRTYSVGWADSTFLDVRGRVASKLLDLASQHGVQDGKGLRIDLRLSQRTLAGMVAVSRENVNRVLSRFASESLIEQRSGIITILDRERLQAQIR